MPAGTAVPPGNPSLHAARRNTGNVLVFFPARCQPTDPGRDRAQAGTAAGSELRKAASAASRGQRWALRDLRHRQRRLHPPPGSRGPPVSRCPHPVAHILFPTPYPVPDIPSPVARIPFPSLSPFPHPAPRVSAAPPSGRSVPRDRRPPHRAGGAPSGRAAILAGLWVLVLPRPCGVGLLACASARVRTGCPWVLCSPVKASARNKTNPRSSLMGQKFPQLPPCSGMVWGCC